MLRCLVCYNTYTLTCEKSDQEIKKSTENFNYCFLAASKDFVCASASKPSLLTAKSFRWLCPCEIWMRHKISFSVWSVGRIHRCCPGKSVAHQWASQWWNWLYGRPAGNWGVGVEAFQRRWIKGAAHTHTHTHTCLKQNRILHTATNRA